MPSLTVVVLNVSVSSTHVAVEYEKAIQLGVEVQLTAQSSKVTPSNPTKVVVVSRYSAARRS